MSIFVLSNKHTNQGKTIMNLDSLLNSNTEYCTGCEFNCVLGARWKFLSLFPAKYHPTVNNTKLEEITDLNGKKRIAISQSKADAIANARIHCMQCARYQHEK